MELYAALIAFLGVILAATLNLYWNFRNAKGLRKQPFLQKQLEFCLEATSVASVLATTTDAAAFEQARQRFWGLYWGPLSVVENRAVEAAMVKFGEALDRRIKERAPLPLISLGPLSGNLAIQVRELILEAWSITSLERVLEKTYRRGAGVRAAGPKGRKRA